ncbi:hypothetical protein ACWGQ4_14275 [Streptomyces sp. NPDC055721]|uniref:hypothetical protein n=1 Tax=Streptomyces sp. NPDC127132 TaxID=3345374 RepID=UPI00363A6198
MITDAMWDRIEPRSRWAIDGTWEMILTAVLTAADAADDTHRMRRCGQGVCAVHVLGGFVGTLTPIEQDLHRVLSRRAREAAPEEPSQACLTYKALGLLVDPEGVNTGMSRPPFRTLFPALGRISAYESEHGRPLLSALVVAQESGTPGPGFAQLAQSLGVVVRDPEAFWEEELAEVVGFWSTHDPVLLLDAAVDELKSELAVLRAAVDRLGGSA